MKRVLAEFVLGSLLAIGSAVAGQDQPAVPNQNAAGWEAQAKQGAAMVLTGDSGGRVLGESAGAVVDPDGFVLTAYHPLRDAQGVQVRLSNGEVYDQVELVGFDERRDVAVLHVPAVGLPAMQMGVGANTPPNTKVWLLASPSGNAWAFSEGTLGALKLADEVSGACRGFRVIQFTATAPPAPTGGILLTADGQMLGLMTTPSDSGPAWAVPIESVLGLANASNRTPLGSGRNLDVANPAPRGAAAPSAESDPNHALTNARTVRISSRSGNFKAYMLENELVNHPGFRQYGLNVVRGSKKVDLSVEVDRPLLSYDFNYAVTDAHSGSVIASGKVTAIDGKLAARGIAKNLVIEFDKAHAAQSAQTGK